MRGYVATGNPAFLAPYNSALARIGADRKAYNAAAAAQGVVKSHQVVDAAVTKVLADLAGLRLAVGHGASASSLSSSLMQDKADMDRLRDLTGDLARAPSAQLLAGRSSTNSLESEIAALDIAGLVLGLLAVLAGIALFTSGIARRVGATAANADRLGEGQPLEPPARREMRSAGWRRALVRAEELLASRAAELTTARDEAMRPPRRRTRSCPARATSCGPR